jgi:type III secretion protein T
MLYNNMLLVIFFQIGGPLIFINSIFTSYEVIPPDQFFSPAFFDKHLPLWHTVFSLVGVLIKLTVQLSAPPVMAMLMSDLFLGIANRMAPQVQISFLLWSLKAYVGIGIIWAGWWYVIKELENEGSSWVKMIETLLQGLKGLS